MFSIECRNGHFDQQPAIICPIPESVFQCCKPFKIVRALENIPFVNTRFLE